MRLISPSILFPVLLLLAGAGILPANAFADDKRLCFVGDTGRGNPGQNRVARSMEENCDEIFLLGDLVYSHGVKSAQDPILEDRFWKPYARLKKMIVVLGNHDYEGDPEAWLKIAENDSRVIHPARFFAYRSGDTCFAVLDTTALVDDKDKPQKRFLKKLDFSKCRVKVALGHHPYWGHGKHGDAIDRLKRYLEKYVLGKFDYYIAGHDHHLEDNGEVQGTRLIVSGSGAEVRKCREIPPGRNSRCILSLGYYRLKGGEGEFVLVE